MKLRFAIVEDPRPIATHSLLDLCDFLTAKVLEPLLQADGIHWDRRFMDFVTVDHLSDPTEPTGVIQLRVPRAFAGRSGALEEAVVTELFRVGIRTGSVVHEPARDRSGDEVLCVPITENPTALIAPPEVNVTYARGCVIMRDLLGYQPVNGGFELLADDLLRRAAAVTEDKIATCTASPVKVSEAVRRVPSVAGTRSLMRCLEEIKRFAQWAVTHNYRRLAAA